MVLQFKYSYQFLSMLYVNGDVIYYNEGIDMMNLLEQVQDQFHRDIRMFAGNFIKYKMKDFLFLDT